MLNKYKVRVFFNAWEDMEVFASGEHEIKEIVQSLDADNLTVEYDFYEVLETEEVKSE